ncbi:pentatricopeptide repeat-containing protein At5g15340, mitochondrial [Aristolochia californica]|uniref:pentatricopeptide repeat-containing protein At5g15340, mitochondrial n=1 Tax=Aristolochia californica TaxID=171875 RepID=UPI0035DA0C44
MPLIFFLSLHFAVAGIYISHRLAVTRRDLTDTWLTLISTDKDELSENSCLRRGKQRICDISKGKRENLKVLGIFKTGFVDPTVGPVHVDRNGPRLLLSEEERGLKGNPSQPLKPNLEKVVLTVGRLQRRFHQIPCAGAGTVDGNRLPRLFSDVHAHIRRTLRTSDTIEEGQKIHALVLKRGDASAPCSFIGNALLHMYAKHGCVSAASQAFHQIPATHRDVVDWTTLIACCARYAFPADALRFYRAMREDSVPYDQVTVVALFSSCAQLLDDATGAWVHQSIVKTGIPFTTTARNAAMDMYAKCGRMGDARRLLDEMMQGEYSGGFPTVVSWTIILFGTVKSEGLSKARQVFDAMPEKNEIAWTVMIAAYVECGYSRKALKLLSCFLWSLPRSNGVNINLNYITICSILSACSQSGDSTVGIWIHLYVTKMATIAHLMIGTALVDMYAKCGMLERARIIFGRMPQRNVVTWNAMLGGLAIHGRGSEALDLFSQMTAMTANHEIAPDDVSLVAVLSACSHSGLVEAGRRYFRALVPIYGIKPKVEHYACMVDLLGRAGLLNEAEALVAQMPMPPNEVVLGSLLASCGLHRNLQLAEKLIAQPHWPHNATQNEVLLSNVYTSAGRWDKGNALRRELRRSGIQKAPGLSYIRLNDGLVHQFCAGDKSHSRSSEVYDMLEEMNQRMRVAGYVPNASSQSSCLLPSIGELDEEREEREQALLYHSERLAIAFGLLSTRDGSPLRIFKNLRVCCDCHTAIKLVSELYSREIVVRDRNRFHHFKKGHCSCSDYW